MPESALQSAPGMVSARPDSVARLAPVQVSAWSTYRTLLRWQVAQIGGLLPFVVVVQALLAGGIIIGFGFLIPDIDSATARFLSTGAPTVLLLTIGLVLVPQGDVTVWLMVAVPSVAVGVVVARLRYDLTFAIDWPLLVTATLLVTIMATAVGYAIAVSMPPMLAQLVTQVLVFFVLLFSPITFPASQLPAWFLSVHDLLPVRAGADLLRAGLASDTFTASGRDLLVLALWCLLGLATSLRALVRRQ